MRWCPNTDHYLGTEPASRSLSPICWALTKAAEPQILTSFVWCGWASNSQPHACEANTTTTLPGREISAQHWLAIQVLTCFAQNKPVVPAAFRLVDAQSLNNHIQGILSVQLLLSLLYCNFSQSQHCIHRKRRFLVKPLHFFSPNPTSFKLIVCQIVY